MSSQRQDRIALWVAADGRVSLTDLARRLAVSEMTIRRDLDVMTAQGRLQRVRGGAVRLPSSGEKLAGSTAGLASARPAPPATTSPGAVITPPVEAPPGIAPGPDTAPRDDTDDPWERAAALATAHLAGGAAVLLTGGPGAPALARHLATRAAGLTEGPTEGLTVVVTALEPAAALLGALGVRLVVLGGEADHGAHPGASELVGAAALAALADLHLDLVLLTPPGLDGRGAWAPTSGSAQLAAAAATAARAGAGRVVAVVGPQALGRPGRVRAVPLTAVDEVVAVSDGDADPAVTSARLQALAQALPTAPRLTAA